MSQYYALKKLLRILGICCSLVVNNKPAEIWSRFDDWMSLRHVLDVRQVGKVLETVEALGVSTEECGFFGLCQLGAL